MPPRKKKAPPTIAPYKPRTGEPHGASFAMAVQKTANKFLAAGEGGLGGPPYFPEYKLKPVEFCIDILGVRPWKGNGKVPGQMDFMRGLVEHPYNLLFAGTGPGKTFIIACAIIWFMCTRRNAIVVTVATTWDQVVNQLWRNIRKLHKDSLVKLPGKVLQHSWEVAEKWFGIGLSPRNPETLAGYHADIEISSEVKKVRHLWKQMTDKEYFAEGTDDHGRATGAAVMLCIDEASGVDDALHDAGEGILTGPGCICIKSGNLTRTDGRFYEHWLDHPTPPGNEVCFPGEEPPKLDRPSPLTLLGYDGTVDLDALEDPVLTESGTKITHSIATTPDGDEDFLDELEEQEDRGEADEVIELARLRSRSSWKAYRWTAFDAPSEVVNREFIMRMRKDCGANYLKNPRYMVRALAIPPLGSELKVFPWGLLDGCKEIHPGQGGRHMGIDLGFGGGDPSVAVLIVDGRVSSIFTWNVQGAVLDTYDAARVIFKLATGCDSPLDAMDPTRMNKGWGVAPRNCHIDATGAGKAVPEDLRRRWRFYCDPVVLSEKPLNDWRFKLGEAPFKLMNRRQELHWIALRLFQEGLLSIPDQEEYGPIWADLGAIQFKSKGLDEFQVELKRVFIEREKRSSDYGDATLIGLSRADPARVRFTTARRRQPLNRLRVPQRRLM